ncbi:hypothetical protein SARC_13690, partial [Sphaeroforma arctica JP610]
SAGANWKHLYAHITGIQKNWRSVTYKRREVKGHGNHVITYLYYDTDKIISASDDHTIK